MISGSIHTLVTPYVECKLEDAPEDVGREMRKFWREDRHQALSVRVFIGFVRPGREPGAGRGREDLREVRRVSVRAVRRKGGFAPLRVEVAPSVEVTFSETIEVFPGQPGTGAQKKWIHASAVAYNSKIEWCYED